jgi:hypothetical protein
MTEAGKIRLDYRGHVWRRSQALFHVGQGGLKLDDFELTGLPAGASVTCDGKTLMMTVGGYLPVPKVLAAGENGPRLWLDASRGDAFVTNAAGGVLRWKDRSGCCNDATNYPYGHWYYPVTGVTNGVPALLMGDAQSGMDLAFPKMDDIRTVFWAMDIADSNYASFLGSFAPDDDQWNQKGQAYQRSGNYRSTGRFGYFLYSLPSQVYQGEMREDGAPAKSETDTELRWISPGKGMHIYSHRVKDDVPAWANNLGRCGNVNYLSGGKAISELIIFNRSLSDDDRAAVENYQLAKW